MEERKILDALVQNDYEIKYHLDCVNYMCDVIKYTFHKRRIDILEKERIKLSNRLEKIKNKPLIILSNKFSCLNIDDE